MSEETTPRTDDKKCTKCSMYKPRSEFSKRTAALDGLQLWCKPCTQLANKKSHKKKIKKEQVSKSTLTVAVEKPLPINRKIIERVTPLYEYLISLPEADGKLTLTKSPSEIIDFFGFKPRVGIDLIYLYIKSEPDNGYVWVTKPKSAKEVAKAYLGLLKIKEPNREITQELLFEQFILMKEEFHELIDGVKKLIN